MGKTRDLFMKIRDTKGTFHAKMSSIKDRNDMDLTEAKDIKKRWQEYTEEAGESIYNTYDTQTVNIPDIQSPFKLKGRQFIEKIGQNWHCWNQSMCPSHRNG